MSVMIFNYWMRHSDVKGGLYFYFFHRMEYFMYSQLQMFVVSVFMILLILVNHKSIPCKFSNSYYI